jgi:hypothetical protein
LLDKTFFSRSSSSSQDPIIDLGYLAQVPSINGDDRKLIDETLQKLVVCIDVRFLDFCIKIENIHFSRPKSLDFHKWFKLFRKN